MTKLFCKNKEKYKEDLECLILYSLGVDKETKKPFYCNPLRKDCRCEKCLFEPKLGSCVEQAYKWLEEENKEPVKLTRAEKTILENIYSDWKWIAREKYGSLYLFQSKPFKQVKYWEEPLGDKGYGITVFGHLFNFIKWEDDEPYNITELLETCEVEDE